MSEKAQNVQDVFLNHLRKNKTPVTIFLVNGVKLQGIVTWFDNFSVLLRRDGHSQLVYKHAISTIMPVTPVQVRVDHECAIAMAKAVNVDPRLALIDRGQFIQVSSSPNTRFGSEAQASSPSFEPSNNCSGPAGMMVEIACL